MTDPTPATPDEAVDILATVIGMRTGTRYDGVPDRSRDLATMFLADLAADGWTLSRQQGDTVAARVDEAMVERVAHALHDATHFDVRRAPQRCCQPLDLYPERIAYWRTRAREALGIGADGAGDGR